MSQDLSVSYTPQFVSLVLTGNMNHIQCVSFSPASFGQGVIEFISMGFHKVVG